MSALRSTVGLTLSRESFGFEMASELVGKRREDGLELLAVEGILGTEEAYPKCPIVRNNSCKRLRDCRLPRPC